MQQFSFIDLFIDLLESALHVSVDKLAQLQEHVLTVYTALLQCTDIAADRWQGWVSISTCILRVVLFTNSIADSR